MAAKSETGANPGRGGTRQNPNENSKQADFIVIDGKAQTRFAWIWAAEIEEGLSKYVLMALTKYGDKDGTNCRPSIETIAADCRLAPSTTRVHVRKLEKAGFVKATSPATQWRATTYTVNFAALAAVDRFRAPADGGLAESRAPANGGLEMLRAPVAALRAPAPGADPNDPDYPNQGQEGGNVVSPTLPLRGHVGNNAEVVIPEVAGVDHAKFTDLVMSGAVTQTRVKALVSKARELVAAGHDVNALLAQALESDWKRFPLPPKPRVPRTSNKRSSASKRTMPPIPENRDDMSVYGPDTGGAA
jgi:DNA-binding Lrp family transcriptional regulator